MPTPFPEHGRPRAEILADLDAAKADDADWRGGRVPLYVFKADDATTSMGQEAFNAFFNENALGGKRAFKSLKRMEDEVVAMALDLFHAPDGAAGGMTTGGTESIVLAVKAARDYARAKTGNASHRGSLVLPETAHPAFDKAARLMDLTVRRIPVRTDLRADPAAMAADCDADTIMMVGSAPCFPYGVIDPIAELAERAATAGVWLHVDACVGGYLAPFVRDIGYPIPDFDFALAGVSSMSADLHKYGFCPKPASTVLYRSAVLKAGQTFDLDVWPSGPFVTDTIVGTRPGGGVAGAWAVMRHLGREGYRNTARQLMAARDAYIAGIEAIPGFRIRGKPDLAIIAFGADDLEMMRVGEEMAARGWLPGLVRKPPSLHMMMSMLHAPAREAYLADLAASAAAVRSGPKAEATLKATY